MPARGSRSIAVIGLIAIFLVLLILTSVNSSESASQVVQKAHPLTAAAKSNKGKSLDIQDADLMGHTIMPKLGNETVKADLGRAAWKVLHTTMARFPDEPTTEESASLKAYLHLFQRLYPCGECSQHFRKIIDKYPPQVSSRSAAAAWACHVHNEVNKSLNKDIFDCSNIGDFYDCGCADDEEEGLSASTKKSAGTVKVHEKPEMSQDRIEKLTGDLGRDFNTDHLLPKLQQEGYGKGG